MKTPDLIRFIGKAMGTSAGSYAEITARVNAMSIEPVVYAQVAQAIYRLRKAEPDEWGWTIPHCKRGPTEPGRLFRMSTAPPAASTFYSQAKVAATEVGAYGSARTSQTMLENVAKHLDALALNLPPHKRRIIRGLRRDVLYIAEKIVDIADDLNGARGP